MDEKLKRLLKKHGHDPNKMKSLGTRPLDNPTPKKINLGYIGTVSTSLHNLESTSLKTNVYHEK